jgi:hypothetical protein
VISAGVAEIVAAVEIVRAVFVVRVAPELPVARGAVEVARRSERMLRIVVKKSRLLRVEPSNYFHASKYLGLVVKRNRGRCV